MVMKVNNITDSADGLRFDSLGGHQLPDRVLGRPQTSLPVVRVMDPTKEEDCYFPGVGKEPINNQLEQNHSFFSSFTSSIAHTLVSS